MDKQREIYRELIAKLFKENFDSALFKEKRNDMMTESDFANIRDETEEEYFTKNRGIVPYMKAINYLRSKIEVCTAQNVLFATTEDYICAKENIAITPVANAAKLVQLDEMKPMKRSKKEKTPTHADCKSPQSCKKCRIMHRLTQPVPKPRKQKRNKIKEIAGKTDPPKPEFSDISDSDAVEKQTENLQLEPTSNGVEIGQIQKPIGLQLPYDDHQYSRISFYGSGFAEEHTKTQENVPAPSSQKSDAEKPMAKSKKIARKMVAKSATKCLPKIVSGSLLKQNRNGGESLLKPRLMPSLQPLVYHFKPNNGLRQTSPANYMPSIITHAPSTVQTSDRPTAVHSVNVNMIQPVSYSNQSILVNSPVRFSAPVTGLQRSMIHQPVYYVGFCEAPKPHYPTTHFF